MMTDKGLSSQAIKFLIVNKVFSLLEIVTKFGIVAYAFIQTVPYLAGETTIVSLLFDNGVSCTVEWLLVVSFLIWALTEKALRYRKTKYLTRRITQLEKQIDPDRTSSGLSETGQTKTEDKVL